MTTPTPGSGDVTITLNGESLTLKCSVEAGLEVARLPGSFYGAGNEAGVAARVVACDIDMYAFLIRVGLGWKANDARCAKLPGYIYEAGVLNLRLPISTFVGNLATGGGKPLDSGGSEDEDPQKS